MSRRPNLLILLPHGLRSDALSDDGSWPLATPHLEALAQAGIRFAAATACPADPGGFVSLFTGLHARQHGRFTASLNPPLADAFPAWLAEVGYHVAGVGCLGPVVPMLDEVVRVEDAAVVEPSDCAYWAALESLGLARAMAGQRRRRRRSGPFDPERLLIEPGDDIDGFIARQAVAALGRLPDDQPWALIVAFSGPGNDLPPPTPYENRADPVALQQGFTPATLAGLDALGEPIYPRSMLQRLEPYTIGRIRADYLGRVGLIDDSVGQLRTALAQRRDAGQTWTLLASDRGHLLGEHGLVGPQSFLAGAVETPLILVPPAPEAAPSAIELFADSLVNTVDFAATVAALGGCDVPRNVVGRSLLPLLVGEAIPELAGGSLSEFNDRLLLETERFKAVFSCPDRQCLSLHDLLHDPDERDNLLANPRGHTLMDALRWRLVDALMPLRTAEVHSA